MHLLAQVNESTDSGVAWYAYLFYVYAIGYLIYLVRKFVLRSQRRKEGVEGADDTGSAEGAKAARPPSRREELAAARAVIESPSDGLTPTQRLFQEERARRAVEEAERTAGARAATAVPRPSEVAAEGPADGGRIGFFAPAPDSSSEREVRPVAEMLLGIRMPCDLAPVTTAKGLFDEFRVAFLTSTATPEEVGRSLADELERLGYAVRSISPTEVEAVRDTDRLRVALHPDARAAGEHSSQLFPHAPAHSVGVVLAVD